MRVIAGGSRGRRLRAPCGHATRPTAARVRESLFSRLGARLDFKGLGVLDLFAGSGALGIEALSRGAARAVFVDRARAAGAAIRRNLAALELGGRALVIGAEVDQALGKLARRGERFDLVLMDPPYGAGACEPVLRRLVDLDLLAAGAHVGVEMSRREAPPRQIGLARVSVATLGDHTIALYRRLPEGPP